MFSRGGPFIGGGGPFHFEWRLFFSSRLFTWLCLYYLWRRIGHLLGWRHWNCCCKSIWTRFWQYDRRSWCRRRFAGGAGATPGFPGKTGAGVLGTIVGGVFCAVGTGAGPTSFGVAGSVDGVAVPFVLPHSLLLFLCVPLPPLVSV